MCFQIWRASGCRGVTGTLGTHWECRTQPVNMQLLSRAERGKPAKLSSHFNVAIFPVKVFGGNSNILLHYFPISSISPAGTLKWYIFQSSKTLSCMPSAWMASYIGHWLWDQNMCGPRTPSYSWLMAPEGWGKHRDLNADDPNTLTSYKCLSAITGVYSAFLGECSLDSSRKFHCLSFSKE